ncbi:MAG: lipoate--protein ligase family protein [Chlamydiota bacterium]
MALRILDTGIASAEENMRLDERLLDELDAEGAPILHFYQWAGLSATYGYFTLPEKHLDLGMVKKHQVNLARRPTGGGIVFHIWDLAFSFLMPSGHPRYSLNTLENYRFVNESVLEVMRTFFSLKEPLEIIPQDVPQLGLDCHNFCMAKPTRYDVVYQGMKIAGAAQRRRKQGYLHQGTISLALPQFELLSEVLLSKNEVLEAMRAYSFAPVGRIPGLGSLDEVRPEIQKLLSFHLMEKLQ